MTGSLVADARHFLKIYILVVLVSSSVSAQQTTFQDSLLDHFTGKWVLQGTIEGKETTHDIVAEWVLGHQYVQFREVSREKKSDGGPMYEAIVFIGWDQPRGQYACLWLDATSGSGLSNGVIGRAKRGGDKIAFVFKFSDSNLFHTTFLYDRGPDAWQWSMDEEEDGKWQPFLRMKMTRRLR
jgi:hypothetical protein